jgi:hypothetical protein
VTACFALGAAAGGISATGHLIDTARLGTATTYTVVLDVAQIVASFASAGVLGITWKAGSASAALANSRWFAPLVGTAASADVVQRVALTDITFTELTKIQNGAGTPEDKQRAMAVLITQLLVVSGLTALSVQGARNVRGLAGKPLEVVEQNGVKVLRVVGDTSQHRSAIRRQPLPRNALGDGTQEPEADGQGRAASLPRPRRGCEARHKRLRSRQVTRLPLRLQEQGRLRRFRQAAERGDRDSRRGSRRSRSSCS